MDSAEYRKLGADAKRAYSRDKAREPAMTCPHCEARASVDDMLTHVSERCGGQREPHPLSRWITVPQAHALGVAETTLRRWVRMGLVRGWGDLGPRCVLKRDVVALLALQSRYVCGDEEPDEEPDESPQLELWLSGRRQ